MIYLIDDKINRQIESGWDIERFKTFVEFIKPIHLYSEIENEKEREEIFADKKNIILFHESFFDNVLNKHHLYGHEIRNRLIQFSIHNPEFYIVFFSGSKNTRSIFKNIVHLPVSILYQNLETFLVNIKNNDLNLRYLMFGEKPQIEEELLSKLNTANKNIEDDFFIQNQNSKNFIAVSQLGEIEAPIENAIYETLFTDDLSDNFKNEIDLYNNAILNEWLSENEYDNIFIPISFGQTLSDFNGLRLATYIRCSNTRNRLKNIFIYSYADFSELISNEYFDILKTKNVFLIKHSKKAFHDAISKEYQPYSIMELPRELANLTISSPKNYTDSHSIANEWAIYRWSYALNTRDKDIEQIIFNVENNLYFKYLSTIYPISDISSIPNEKLKFKYEGSPKILLIDDEAEKGWYEIFLKIIGDINKIDKFFHLDEEFNSKTKEEIIDISLKKVNELQCDLVYLDFRLHEDDNFTSDFDEITGIKILRGIKSLNPGIQVIVFTASEKAMHIQSLIDAGADGYIIKESPRNSNDSTFTNNTILKFIQVTQKSINAIFLKECFINLENLKQNLIPRKKPTSTKPLPKEFVDEIIKWHELTYNLLLKDLSDTNITAAFLFLFSILENISNNIINSENPIPIDRKPGFFKFEFRKSDKKLRRFIEDENNPGYYRRTNSLLESKRNMPWIYKILNTLDFLTEEQISENEINLIINKRNDIIHANSTLGQRIEVSKSLIMKLDKIIYLGLQNL